MKGPRCEHGEPVYEDCDECRRLVFMVRPPSPATPDALIQHYARCILAADLPETREEFAREIAKLVTPQ